MTTDELRRLANTQFITWPATGDAKTLARAALLMADVVDAARKPRNPGECASAHYPVKSCAEKNWPLCGDCYLREKLAAFDAAKLEG